MEVEISDVQGFGTMIEEVTRVLVDSNNSSPCYIILCYSIIANNTFKMVDTWQEAIDKSAKGRASPIALVGCKQDLEEHRMVSVRDLRDKKEAINAQENTSGWTPENMRCTISKETTAFEDGKAQDLLK